MGQLVSDRVCYKHGVVKPESELPHTSRWEECGFH